MKIMQAGGYYYYHSVQHQISQTNSTKLMHGSIKRVNAGLVLFIQFCTDTTMFHHVEAVIS